MFGKGDKMLRSKIAISILVISAFVCLGNSSIYAVDTDAIYAEKCALCHGDDGKGSPTGIDFGVKNFTDQDWLNSRTVDDFTNSITNGNPDNDKYLPFGDILSEEEITAMANYVIERFKQ
jgi:mono/diheme cytochrome c family protein